ncbi:MAG: tetratricopeptide repeat protein, partial [bacterium]
VHDHSFQHPQRTQLESSLHKINIDSLDDVRRDKPLQVEIFAMQRVSEQTQKYVGEKEFQAISAQFMQYRELISPSENHQKTRSYAVLAPLKDNKMPFEPGESIRIDVLVKSKNIGHAFPAGSPGAAEAWLEIQVKDNAGNLIYHTGKRPEKGKFPGDAHYFGARFIDENGEHLNFAHGIGAKAVSHFNFLPPEAIDLSSFVFHLPKNCGTDVYITANLLYRKTGLKSKSSFANAIAETNGSLYSTNQDQEDVLPDFQKKKLRPDDKFGDAAIVTLSADKVILSRDSNPGENVQPEYREKNLHLDWNNYGLGLLRRNRRDEALGAFQKAIDLQPDFFAGHINIARVHLLSGKPELAMDILLRVLKTDDENPKAKYFLALALKATGKLKEAKEQLNKLRKTYPEDRAILNELGHIYYLLESYKAAHRIFRAVTHFAPDDPVAHFFLSHVYRKLKKPEKAAYAEKLYARFSKRINNYVVTPLLVIEKSFQDWQVLPWANYDRYSQ